MKRYYKDAKNEAMAQEYIAKKGPHKIQKEAAG
jgi:hypothetical protein